LEFRGPTLKGTLKSRRAFHYIYDHGTRAIGSHVVVFALAGPDDALSGESPGAVGVVASRKVGHSPDRSRARRVLRAALRQVRTRRRLRGHVILVARRALIVDGVGTEAVAIELEDLLDRTGTLEGCAK
jgi:ribonuclease P protein component